MVLLSGLVVSPVFADANPFERLALAAEETPSAAASASEAPATSNPFDEGSWVFTTYGSGTWGENSDALYGAHVGGGYYFIDGLSINLEATGYYLDIHDGSGESGGTTGGGGLDALFRWHFLRDEQEGKWSIYFDAGAGILQSGESIPADGSNFNFTPQAGVGGTLKICDGAHLMGGARWFHASNAGTHANNPGYNGVEAYVGLMIPF
jgi:hypothetical protein